MLSTLTSLVALAPLFLAIPALKITYPTANTTQIPLSPPLQLQWDFDIFTDPEYISITISCADSPSKIIPTLQTATFGNQVLSAQKTYTFSWESYTDFHAGLECIIALTDWDSKDAVAITRDFTLVNGNSNASNPQREPSPAGITYPTSLGVSDSKSGTTTTTATLRFSSESTSQALPPSSDYPPPPFNTFSATIPALSTLQANLSAWRSTQTSFVLAGITFLPTTISPGTEESTSTAEHGSVTSPSRQVSAASEAAPVITPIMVVTVSPNSTSKTATSRASVSGGQRSTTSGAGKGQSQVAWRYALVVGIITFLRFWTRT
jgi:hypothetical protein